MRINPDEMISQAEAARIRGVSHQAIVNLVKRGRLRTIKIGGKVLLFRSEVESYKKIREGRPSAKKKSQKARTKKRAS